MDLCLQFLSTWQPNKCVCVYECGLWQALCIILKNKNKLKSLQKTMNRNDGRNEFSVTFPSPMYT